MCYKWLYAAAYLQHEDHPGDTDAAAGPNIHEAPITDSVGFEYLPAAHLPRWRNRLQRFAARVAGDQRFSVDGSTELQQLTLESIATPNSQRQAESNGVYSDKASMKLYGRQDRGTGSCELGASCQRAISQQSGVLDEGQSIELGMDGLETGTLSRRTNVSSRSQENRSRAHQWN